ncbi:MAG: hypothetical protein H6746_03760 [Deltaproteobacteria bacterium]|nr:hypothetical protein [Deltaproteobacteria bacterium]
MTFRALGLMCTFALPCAALALAGCADADADAVGTYEVRIYGEEYIEEGIPESVFADGWSISFDEFLVVISDVEVRRGAATPVVEDATSRAFDLTAASSGEGQRVLQAEVPIGTYDEVAYRVAPATAATVAGNATPAQLAELRAGGYALLVAGTAVKAGVTKSFRLGFQTHTRYDGCEAMGVVSATSPGVSQITIHADHLLYDSLVSETPSVRFDLVASADDAGDANGEITAAELAATNILAEENYQTGNQPITDLWAYMAYQSSTVGHIDGEGHCTNTAVE